MSSPRMEKVNQQIRREISSIIQAELGDPRFQFVSITHVEVSKDLRHARVMFSCLGEGEDIVKTQEALQRVRGLIRKHIGARIKMRYTPELTFLYDKSLQESYRIEQTLKEIQDESEKDQ